MTFLSRVPEVPLKPLHKHVFLSHSLLCSAEVQGPRGFLLGQSLPPSSWICEHPGVNSWKVLVTASPDYSNRDKSFPSFWISLNYYPCLCSESLRKDFYCQVCSTRVSQSGFCGALILQNINSCHMLHTPLYTCTHLHIDTIHSHQSCYTQCKQCTCSLPPDTLCTTCIYSQVSIEKKNQWKISILHQVIKALLKDFQNWNVQYKSLKIRF